MRILIVSDTHGNHKSYDKVLERVGKIDLLLHAGDTEGGEYYIEKTANCPVHIVSGNNDFFSDLPEEEEFHIGQYKVLLTHGHKYYVSMDTRILKQEAMARGVHIVVYGHTHKPDLDLDGEVSVINPGSLSYPRQPGREKTYVIMEIDDSGSVKFELQTV